MQKSTTLLLFALTLSVWAQAQDQCPDPPLPGPEVMWLPNAYDYLPQATTGTPYSGFLQVFVPADSAYNLGGDWVTVDVIGFWVDSISGLPGQFAYESDPPEGFFAGGYPACIKFSCPSVAEPLGVYNITVHFTAQINFGASTVYAFTHPIKLRIAGPEGVSDLPAPVKAWIDPSTNLLHLSPTAHYPIEIITFDLAGRTADKITCLGHHSPIKLTENGPGLVEVRFGDRSTKRLFKQ